MMLTTLVDAGEDASDDAQAGVIFSTLKRCITSVLSVVSVADARVDSSSTSVQTGSVLASTGSTCLLPTNQRSNS